VFEEWRVNESLTVSRNPKYWRDGYPKVDEIVFRPVPESIQRVNGLRSGDLDIVQTSNSMSIVDLRRDAEAGEIKLVASDEGSETAYLMLNNSKPPFDDPVAREAVAFTSDAREVNEVQNKGLNRVATGPFPPDSPAYLPGIARHHDLKKGRRLAKQYERDHGEPIRFEYLTGTEPDLVKVAQQVQEQQSRAGIKVTIRSADQSTLINEALAGNFQAAAWRNHPGGDPDSNYVWWHSESPVNFGRIGDPVIDQLLEEGRVEIDPAKRTAIYRDLNRRFAEQLYNLWSWYTLWAVATRNDVRGITGPALPDGGGRPLALYGGVIPVLAIAKG
jgi:peptide/nickel transport system substrate-binding protein